jgi:uncharacterized membrane protein YccC
VRRISDPNDASLRKAARVVVVACVSFFVGRYVVQDAQLTVIATFTAIALTGIADFSGTMRGRALANAVSTLVGVGMISLGTWASTDTAAASGAMFLVVFVVSFSGVYSGYFAAGTNAVILFYLVASGIPAPAAAIPSRVEGLLFAGSLATIASVTLWPLPYGEGTSRRIGEALSAVREMVAAAAPGSGRDPSEVRATAERSRSAVTAATVEVLAARGRVGAPTAVERAQAYLFHWCDRMADLAFELCRLPHRPVDPALIAAYEEATAGLERLLERCARCLCGGLAPDVGEALDFRRSVRAATTRPLTSMMARGADAAGFALEEHRTFLLDELSAAAVLVVARTRLAMRFDSAIDLRVLRTGAPGAGIGSRRWGSGAPSKWLRRARANLRPASVHLRNSVRLAIGLSLARVLVGVLDLQHGFWVAFSTLAVLRSSASGTASTALQAVAGTLVGFGASTVLALALGAHGAAYSVALPVVLFLAIYCAGVVSFVVGQAFFTMVIVVLFNLLQPEGWRVGLLRLEDVATGAAIGILIGLAVWPRGAGGQLGRACADLLDAAGRYARSTVLGLLGMDGPGTVPATRELALDAAVRAEDVFAQYTSERPGAASVRAWARLLAGGHRLWVGADAMRAEPVAAPPNQACGSLARALEEVSSSVESGLHGVAEALRGRPAPPPGGRISAATPQLGDRGLECLRSMAGETEQGALHRALLLFRTRSWLSNLSDDVVSLAGSVPEATGRPSPPLPPRWAPATGGGAARRGSR